MDASGSVHRRRCIPCGYLNCIISRTYGGRRNGQCSCLKAHKRERWEEEAVEKRPNWTRNHLRKTINKMVVSTVMFITKTLQGRVTTGSSVPDMAGNTMTVTPVVRRVSSAWYTTSVVILQKSIFVLSDIIFRGDIANLSWWWCFGTPDPLVIGNLS